MPSLTITLSVPAAARLRKSLGDAKGFNDNDGNPLDATLDDIKEYIIEDLRQLIRASEKRAAVAAATSGVVPNIT